jgi:hypothetical protein
MPVIAMLARKTSKTRTLRENRPASCARCGLRENERGIKNGAEAMTTGGRSTGILYAMSDDGRRLPVIDVTNPAFAISVGDAELDALADQFVTESKARQRGSAFLQRVLLRFALRDSTIGRGLIAAMGTFLTGMNTYLLKLGPDNLWPDATPMDRRIAASFPAFTTRLRLQDMAQLLADGLSVPLAANMERPLSLINIAGGPSADSLNAIILLAAEHRQLISGRPIHVVVLDVEQAGPSFAARALDALRSPNAPLNGFQIDLRHIQYDWSDSARLEQILASLQIGEAVCAISSEGGLFEYGSDVEVAANLASLHRGTPPDAMVVGSVTRDGEPVRFAQTLNRVPTQPRTLEAFQSLAGKAGWKVQHSVARPFNYNVRLTKM